ncbi:glycosyltransferase family 39 protein [Microbacterium sp. P01]|uniref:glycosyltransferase family 39 protein n=1 Tax=unclassified Microbacterium TaxID=2609290 RepID=UPI0036732399
MIQRIDAVHALYYAVMSVWVDLFGASPFSLRLPSALAGGGVAVGVYLLARVMTTPRTALVAAIVSMTLPRLTWGGIEARPFIFSALAAIWATYFLAVALARRRVAPWVAYTATAVVGIGLNVYLVTLVAAHAVTVVLLARRDRFAIVGYIAAAAAAGVLSIPLLLLVRSQQGQLGGNGDRSLPSIVRKILVNQFFLGETPDPDASAMWFTVAWQGAALLAAAVGIAAMLIAMVRPAAPGDDKRRVLATAIPWIILPTAAIGAYAVAVSPIYQPRYFTFTAPAAALLIAMGLRAAGRRWYTVVGVVLYAMSIAVIFVSQRTPFAKSGSDWSAVAGIIAQNRIEGDGVYFAPRYPDQRDVVEMTTRRIAASYPGFFGGLTDLTLERTGAETATLDGFSRPIDSAATPLSAQTRVWAIFNQKSLPAVRAESSELFAKLGFEAEVVWNGPSTLVIEYTRSD